jgi:ABC-type branched-subunit amino acid transport system substrate-binding protein
MLAWPWIAALLIALSSAKQLKLCLILPFNDAYKQVQLGALQAVDDINNVDSGLVGQFKMNETESSITSAISDLNIVLDVVEQTSVLGTYDSASVCMNNGAHAVIGPAYSSRSQIVSQYLSRSLHKPLISFSATSPTLSDGATYPYFSRTVTPDDAVAFAAIDFVKQAGWSKVAFLYSEDIYGQGLHAACRNYAEVHSTDFGPDGLGWLSVPFPAELPTTGGPSRIETAITTIRDSDSLVIFFAGVSATTSVIIEKAIEHGIIGNTSGYTWLGFDTWGRHSVTGASITAMSGSIRFQASGCPGGPANNSIINKLRASNPAVLSTKYGGQEMPLTYAEMGSIDCRAGFSYDAVWLAALAFSKVNATVTSSNRSTCAAAAVAAGETALFQGSRLWQAILQTSFTGGSGEVWLASNGDRAGASIKVSIENLRADDVTAYAGELQDGVATAINFSNIVWANGGNDMPRADLGDCPGGWVHNDTARACHECAAGRYAEVGASTCTVCDDGKYNQRVGSTSCEECAAIQGIADQCQTCRAGQYRLSKMCIDCDRNKFCDSVDSSECKTCPAGMYQLDKGKGYCSEVQSGSVMVQRGSEAEEVLFEERRCPSLGVDCEGGAVKYTGSVWHSTNIATPNCTADVPPVCTLMYICITEGCPDKGATSMACKKGYVPESPLCALCEEGYVLQARHCVACGKPHYGLFAGVALVAILLGVPAIRKLRKYRKYLHNAEAFSHAKIIISFFTVLATTETQFGVVWPPAFANALEWMSVLSINLAVMSNIFCMHSFTFIESLCSNTLLLVALCVASITIGYCQRWASKGLYFANYLLIFAYAQLSLKIVAAFACHNIDGTLYLREDYSLQCNSADWDSIVAYASCWLVMYVFGYPLLVMYQLYLHGSGGKQYVDLRFLQDDYKHGTPLAYWEVVDLLRKLLLSVMGVFWSSQSTLCVGTALLISAFFTGLQAQYQPYRSASCNRLQLLCMSTLSLVYFWYIHSYTTHHTLIHHTPYTHTPHTIHHTLKRHTPHTHTLIQHTPFTPKRLADQGRDGRSERSGAAGRVPRGAPHYRLRLLCHSCRTGGEGSSRLDQGYAIFRL